MSHRESDGLPLVHACRYVTALREGGSLPAIVETDRGDLVVAKWRGAGQGVAALVAEIIGAELARSAGLPVPPLVIVTLDAALARTERDPEVRDLLLASVGTNLGMGYLSGALAYDPAAGVDVDGGLASRVVMFDSFVMNVDRTARNTNLLWHDERLWLIDHGASLYWHHGWDGALDRPARAFPLVAEHVLLRQAHALAREGASLLAAMTDAVVEAAVAAVPGEWLAVDDEAARRGAYVDFLRARRDASDAMIEEAERARAAL